MNEEQDLLNNENKVYATNTFTSSFAEMGSGGHGR